MNSSKLISLSMLFSLFLENKTILLCFFLFFLIVFKFSFVIPLLKEHVESWTALVISTIKTLILTKNPKERPPVATDKTSNVLSTFCQQKQQHIYYVFHLTPLFHNKIIFYSIDFINCKLYCIVYLWIHIYSLISRVVSTFVI